MAASSSFRENLVEQVVFNVFCLYQLLREFWVALSLLIAQGFKARPERFERRCNRLRGRGKQFSQDEGSQVTLALRQRITIGTL